jgi:AP2 domain
MIPRLIPIGTKNWALVDEEDYEQLKNRKWYLSSRNYAVTKFQSNGPWIMMHRLIMGLNGSPMPWLDHRNGNTLDNRRINLRVCDGVGNAANRKKMLQANPDRVTSSQYKGVTFKKSIKRWNARIGSDSARKSLGCYATEEEAARAYNEAAKILYGEFAQLNHIP